jgi:hypothetical protein
MKIDFTNRFQIIAAVVPYMTSYMICDVTLHTTNDSRAGHRTSIIDKANILRALCIFVNNCMVDVVKVHT